MYSMFNFLLKHIIAKYALFHEQVFLIYVNDIFMEPYF